MWAVPLAAHFSDGGAGTNVTGAVLGVDFLWGETQTAVYAAIGHMETSARKEHGASRGEGIWLGGKLGRTFASGLRFEGQLRGGIYSAERNRTAELAQSISRIETDETVYALSGARHSWRIGRRVFPARSYDRYGASHADTDGIRNGSTLYSPLLPAFGSCRRGADRECAGSLAVFGLCLELEPQHRMDEGAY